MVPQRHRRCAKLQLRVEHINRLEIKAAFEEQHKVGWRCPGELTHGKTLPSKCQEGTMVQQTLAQKRQWHPHEVVSQIRGKFGSAKSTCCQV